MTIRVLGDRIELFWDSEMVAGVSDPTPIPGGNIALENIDGTVWYDNILLCAFALLQEKPPVSPDNAPLSAWEASKIAVAKSS
ncbi:MAG: hypothetical protein GY803_32400 [Chloroflexi bacterium]|nr:hypothetical protein [Chloroflexota bacterium]